MSILARLCSEFSKFAMISFNQGSVVIKDMQEILMTPDVCMRFLVWSYYYHDIMPQKAQSYKACGKFSDSDAERLDELKTMLFKCFEEQSVVNACRQFQLAKVRQEPCPFTKAELDMMFAEEK